MKKIFILILSGILFLSDAAFAAGQEDGDKITPILCNIAKAIYGASWGIIAICWSVVAALFLTTFGNPERLKLAKKAVIVAIIGTAIILLGTLSINIIKNAIGMEEGENICDIKEAE
ncbi:MAG: hypothetical protein CEN87_389 [Parcubacteria group bacterium Licking1014_1]|nr:MAG: hypothetical protein CEN87_389 [Parcubacteria group bacterium Licking1014_1]